MCVKIKCLFLGENIIFHHKYYYLKEIIDTNSNDKIHLNKLNIFKFNFKLHTISLCVLIAS